MAVDINLLPKEEREKTSKTQLRKKVNVFSIAILVLILIVLAGVFSYWAFLKTKENSISKKIRESENQIQSLSQTESLFRILRTKGQSIAQIFSKQKNYGETLGNFSTFVPTGVYLTDFSVTEDGKLKTSGVAANSQEFSNLILTLIDKESGGKFYDQVAVDSLSGTREGGFKFTLSVHFK